MHEKMPGSHKDRSISRVKHDNGNVVDITAKNHLDDEVDVKHFSIRAQMTTFEEVR